jgi:dienelactone hydrolase
LHVNPAKVGILGFSAGGEVAVLAATKEWRKNYFPLEGVIV